jgi:hypothetical protein
MESQTTALASLPNPLTPASANSPRRCQARPMARALQGISQNKIFERTKMDQKN